MPIAADGAKASLRRNREPAGAHPPLGRCRKTTMTPVLRTRSFSLFLYGFFLFFFFFFLCCCGPPETTASGVRDQKSSVTSKRPVGSAPVAVLGPPVEQPNSKLSSRQYVSAHPHPPHTYPHTHPHAHTRPYKHAHTQARPRSGTPASPCRGTTAMTFNTHVENNRCTHRTGRARDHQPYHTGSAVLAAQDQCQAIYGPPQRHRNLMPTVTRTDIFGVFGVLGGDCGRQNS